MLSIRVDLKLKLLYNPLEEKKTNKCIRKEIRKLARKVVRDNILHGCSWSHSDPSRLVRLGNSAMFSALDRSGVKLKFRTETQLKGTHLRLPLS